ncbi:50S ribosomal protein L19, partial [Candidatus Roizmanbacteria bacterium]|nr:50S ribosomal protein L19 [Candidatus Roizmanbacteria bacterium]
MSVIAKHNDIPFHVGDTIRVHYRIIEKEKIAGKTKKSVKEEIKERVQPFEGVVMGVRGVAENKSFTVRRIGADNIGIERVFPLISPW